MKYTLGPWLVRYDEFIARNLTAGDARLIAAAPEMLAALLCINAVLNQNKTFPEDLEYIQRVANDAINKAVGEE